MLWEQSLVLSFRVYVLILISQNKLLGRKRLLSGTLRLSAGANYVASAVGDKPFLEYWELVLLKN